MTQPGAGAPHGSLGEEVAKIVEVLQGWLAGGLAGVAVGDGPECRLCPLCQLLAALRTTRPDAYAHLTDAAGSAAAALRAAVEGAEHAWAAPGRPASQRIDIT